MTFLFTDSEEEDLKEFANDELAFAKAKRKKRMRPFKPSDPSFCKFSLIQYLVILMAILLLLTCTSFLPCLIANFSSTEVKEAKGQS